jgi:predicted RNA-binding protein YlqC (UPF0109 family)
MEICRLALHAIRFPMDNREDVQEWLLQTVRLIVDHPDEVMVEAKRGGDYTMFQIRLNPSDVGKVIGKQGRTSQSVRVLAGAMGKKIRWRFIIEVVKAAA